MNTYEFLTQSPKQIANALKAAGIIKYKDVPNSVDDLNKLLGLESDDRITYYQTITRGGGTEWYYHLSMDFGFGRKRLEIELSVKGKTSVNYVEVGGYHTNVDIYEKECPLFDDRPEYNNLEFRIEGKEYTPYAPGWDNKPRPVFDNDKPLSEYIDTIARLSAEYKPFIEMAEKACFNGEYIKAHDRYNFNPFKPGDEILGSGPSFGACVHAMHKAKHKYKTDLTMDDVHALHALMMRNVKEVQSFFRHGTAKTRNVSLYQFFHEGDCDLSESDLKEMLKDAKAGKVDKEKNSWESTLLKANRELHHAIKSKKEELADKYKIPVDYLSDFYYDEDSDTCTEMEMPQELAGRFD